MSSEGLEPIPGERWRLLPRAPFYWVSDHGRVWSYRRLVGQPLKPYQTSRYGHLAVRLRTIEKEGLQQRFVHQLVLEAFVGPAPEGHEACHNDGDPANNLLSNLRWGTRSDNTLDAVRHGTHPQASKTHCPQGHEYTPENTYIHPTSGGRTCRICSRALKKARRAKAKAANQ